MAKPSGTVSPTRSPQKKKRALGKKTVLPTSKPLQIRGKARKRKKSPVRKSSGSRYAILDDEDEAMSIDDSKASDDEREFEDEESEDDSTSSSEVSDSPQSPPARRRSGNSTGRAKAVSASTRGRSKDSNTSDAHHATTSGSAPNDAIALSSDGTSDSSDDGSPPKSDRKITLDKAPNRQAQLDYEMGRAEEDTRVVEWESQIEAANLCVLRMYKAGIDSKKLRNKITGVKKAIVYFRRAQGKELETRLKRYEDPSGLTPREKAELTKLIGSRQGTKRAKLRGVEILFNGMVGTLDKCSLEVSAAANPPPSAPNRNSGNQSERAASDVARAASVSQPSQDSRRKDDGTDDDNANREYGSRDGDEDDRSESVLQPPRSPVSERQEESGIRAATSQSASTSGLRSDEATGSTLVSSRDLRAAIDPPHPSSRRNNHTVRNQTAPGTDQPSATTGGTQDRNTGGTLSGGTGSDGTRGQNTLGTGRGRTAAGTSSSRRQSQLPISQGAPRPRMMLGIVQDTSQAPALLFDGAPSEEDCRKDANLWGRYIDFLAGRHINRSSFIRLILMIEYSQIPPEYFVQDERAEKSILRYLGAYFGRLEEVSDGKIVLNQFSVKRPIEPLLVPRQFQQLLPKLTLGQARKYFPRLNGEPNNNNQIWCDGMILTNDPQTVMQEAYRIFRSSEFAVRATPHAIQDAEDTATVGFGVYTDSLLSPVRILQRLQTIAECPIAIKHKRVQQTTQQSSIRTLKPGSDFHKLSAKDNADERDLPFADHFICRPKDEDKVQKTLEKEFRLGGSANLGFRKLRFVPKYDKCITEGEKKYYRKAVRRQKSFKTCAAILEREGVADLDSTIRTRDGKDVSLQHILERYPRRDGSRTRLFIRCEWIRGQEGKKIGLGISPSDRFEAEAAIDGLVAYCRHHYGDESLQWFSLAEQRLRENDVWDPRRKCVKLTGDTVDQRAAEEEDAERWEFCDEGEDEPIPEGGAVDKVPTTQALDNRAIHGREDAETMGSLRETRANPVTPGETVTKDDLEQQDDDSCGASTKAKLDYMMQRIEDDCESLSIPFSAASITSAGSTREKLRLLSLVRKDIKAEKARARESRLHWEDQKSSKSEQSPGSDSTEHTTNTRDAFDPGTTFGTQGGVAKVAEKDSGGTNMDVDSHDASRAVEGNIGPREGKSLAAGNNQACGDSRGVHGGAEQPLHSEQSSAAGLSAGGAGS